MPHTYNASPPLISHLMPLIDLPQGRHGRGDYHPRRRSPKPRGRRKERHPLLHLAIHQLGVQVRRRPTGARRHRQRLCKCILRPAASPRPILPVAPTTPHIAAMMMRGRMTQAVNAARGRSIHPEVDHLVQDPIHRLALTGVRKDGVILTPHHTEVRVLMPQPAPACLCHRAHG